MRLLAVGAVGVAAALLAAALTGVMPRLAWVRPADRPRLGRQAVWLRQAGVTLSPMRFWVGSLALGASALLVLAGLTGTPLVAAVPAASVALLPRAYFARRRAARLSEVRAAWPDGLRDLLASVASGRSLAQGLVALAETGPVPLREALERFPLLARLLGTVAALEVIKEELADPTSDRVLEVLVLAQERGGRIVRDILEDLVVATTKDLKLLDDLETEGLEMRINTRAVVVLPWLVLVALTLRPGPFRAFYASPGGLVVVLVGAALSAVGYAWVSRLGRIGEEPRVLGAAATRSVR